MQGLIDQNQSINSQKFVSSGTGILNDNVLIKASPKSGPSFAQEMQNLKLESQVFQGKPEATENKFSQENSKPRLINTFNESSSKTNNPEAQKNLEAELANAKKMEQLKEQQKISQIESGKIDSEEIGHKFKHSETTMAAAAQDHHQKQVTEAAKEGNLSQQENNNYDDANDRKRQLANWENLAPRITEDIKNRAVRIDIPGVNDIQTLIVRMKQNKVNIQAVGDRTTMAALESRKAELAFMLNKKNVSMGELQVFDSNSLAKKKKVAA